MRYWLLIACLLGSPALQAETLRSAVRHKHGSSDLRIAVDGADMTIDLDGPAGNILGFEHVPATPGEKSALAKALDTLRSGDNLFLTPPVAACRMVSAAVSPPVFGTGDHADLRASWSFHCGSPPSLQWVEAQLMAVFPDVVKLTTAMVSPGGQKAVVLTPGTPRALLPGQTTTR
ncbi:MAG: DUF2796 domain-containing protein [Gammaproteobacteria bacterium]